jgi:hypothetical protein
VRGIALEPTTDASGPLGVIGFMKAAFGLRFLPAFFAFFFAISISPLNELRGMLLSAEFRSRFPLPEGSGDVKMPKKHSRVNDFHREIATLSLGSRPSAAPRT